MKPVTKTLHHKEEDQGMTVQFTLNGEEVEQKLPPERRVVDLIRSDCGLTGTKVSCEVGRCGACMVLVDGRPMNSCLLMAYQIDGRRIDTIEGLSEKDSQVNHIQQLFLEEGALQCGYCTPGMIVSLSGYLKKKSDPSHEDLKDALSGNLCRCTGYGGIHRVLEQIADGSWKKEGKT
ncbi:(2Fe-2S)-binding protein [Salisediminibacterium beveridgei]|uniref:Xanthine dehydrogenase iron-sulfur subunit n=1 Tax=Salisediminibacterium beveridgei TaxID=632773 RepID=A0A1D7QYF6_9BACI|nr:(2Fe-2S)-binding protein [Salisediminibacterium beveridgei]AOM84032.1 Xanthine dehydrogenase iron-sulfur subunit [Salisediminibacterium beveridgei]